ncbi:MAG: ferrichrome-iron receptor [Bacteroidetes bacterium]|nr:ferrichrome-iron receptor [Bacteroidota bacterium]
MKQNFLFLRLFTAVLLLWSVTVVLQAQQKQSIVSGRIFTSDGKPAPGVNILIEELKRGGESNRQGTYALANVPAGHYTLAFSFIGLQTIKVTVDVRAGENLHLSDVTLSENAEKLQEVEIVAQRSDRFSQKSSESVAKLPLSDLENPQVYNTVTKAVLKEQVVTNLNNALKNATGITRLWESTGRGGDGAEYYTMRGFSLQPTIVNGVANINNGALDPANVENIEVIKGPSGTLYGGNLIYYGGLININTKRPYDTFGGELGYITGSYGLQRMTADFNTPLSPKASLRLNAAYHYENSFQDAGFTKSIFIAPSFKFKASDRLTFLINAEYKSGESANAPMLFLSRYSKLSFSNLDLFAANYKKSYTSNALTIQNPTFGMQAQALYKIGNGWSSQTILSSGNTKTDGYYQYLWDLANGSNFIRYISKRNGQTNTLDLQQNFMADHTIGQFRNRLVVGIDYLQKEIRSNSTGWVSDGVVSLSGQTDTGTLTTQGVDALLSASQEGLSTATTKIWSGYVSDVFNFTPQLAALVGLRVDNFHGIPGYSTEEIKSQTTWSHKVGLVYQPILEKLSFFANYMNGFQNLDPVEVSDVDGSNTTLKILKPEKANQWEIGLKTNLLTDRIALTASYYSILVSNKSMTDPNNVNNTVQDGQVESKGVEVSLVANPFAGLNLISGYSHNYNKVTKDAADGGYLGLRTEEAGPADLFNLWISYKPMFGALKGWGIGCGANYAGEHKTLNRYTTGTFTLPAYTVFNALISYSGDNYTVSLKGDNIGNKYYYSGWSTVTPQKLRTISVALNYKF